MERAVLKKYIYTIFSDRIMFICALIIVPIIIVEIVDPTWVYIQQLQIVDWIVWSIFLAEFLLKVLVEDSLKIYIIKHKLAAALSIIIIASGIIALFVSLFPFPALGVLRLSRIFRVASYGDRAAQ